MVKNNRAIALIIGIIQMSLLGLIYAWSLFRGPFTELFTNWTQSNMSMVFTFSMIFFSLGGFTSGKSLNRTGGKFNIIVASLFLFSGFFGTSLLQPNVSNIILIYLSYGVLAGFGVGIGYNTVIGSVGRLFPDRHGLVSGILLMAFGSGGLVFGGIIERLLTQITLLELFRYLAFIFLIVFLISSIFYPKKTVSSVTTVASNSLDVTSGMMIKQTKFWLFFFWGLIVSAAGLMIINNAASIATFYNLSAILGMVVSMFNGIGRVFFGYIYDKFGQKNVLYFNSLLVILGGAFLLIGHSMSVAAMILIGLIIIGTSYGGAPSNTASFVNKEFGAAYFAENYSVMNFLIIPAAIIGPNLSTVLFDLNGKFNLVFIAIIIIGILSLIILMLLNKNNNKR